MFINVVYIKHVCILYSVYISTTDQGRTVESTAWDLLRPGKSSLIFLLITLVWDGVPPWKYLQVIKVSGWAENYGCNSFTLITSIPTVRSLLLSFLCLEHPPLFCLPVDQPAVPLKSAASTVKHSLIRERKAAKDVVLSWGNNTRQSHIMFLCEDKWSNTKHRFWHKACF